MLSYTTPAGICVLAPALLVFFCKILLFNSSPPPLARFRQHTAAFESRAVVDPGAHPHACLNAYLLASRAL